MTPFSYVVVNIWRNKRRSLLTFLSLGASVFLVAALEGLLDHLERFPKEKGGATRLVCHSKISFLEKIPESHVVKIRSMRGVASVTPYVYFGGLYRDLTPQTSFPQMAIDADSLLDVIPEIETLDLSTRRPDPGLYAAFRKDRASAIAGLELFERFGWRPGDHIVIEGTMTPVQLELTLVAPFRTRAGAESNLLYFHYRYLDEVAGRPGTVRAIMLRADDADAIPLVIDKIDGTFANSDHETLTEPEQALRMRALTMLGNIEFLLRSITMAVAVMMLMVSANTMSMVTRERTTEIAILKAVGFEPRRVMLYILAESTFVALAAAVLAIAVLYTAVPVARSYFRLTMFARLMGDFRVGAEVPVRAMALGLGVGCLSAVLPAWNAARKPILEGMRRVV